MIDPGRDALVVVDNQNVFCPAGALGVAGGDEVVPVLNAYAERSAAAGAPVVVTRDWPPTRSTHFRDVGGGVAASLRPGDSGRGISHRPLTRRHLMRSGTRCWLTRSCSPKSFAATRI